MSWHCLQEPGGGILGSKLLGCRCVAACEIEPYPRDVLLARQRDGHLPNFPVWDDVRTFDGHPWRGLVDIVTGGFPCQDISCAGKGRGIEGARSGLWSEMFRIICEVRPTLAFVENSNMLTRRGLHKVLADLSEAGYDACWTVLSAGTCGAPHIRRRLWLLAVDRHAYGAVHSALREISQNNANSGGICGNGAGNDMGNTPGAGREGGDYGPSEAGRTPCAGQANEPEGTGAGAPMANTDGKRRPELQIQQAGTPQPPEKPWEHAEPVHAGGQQGNRPRWWATEPRLGRVAHGVADRVERLRAIGNGQVPLVAAVAARRLARIMLKGYGK